MTIGIRQSPILLDFTNSRKVGHLDKGQDVQAHAQYSLDMELSA